MWAVLGQTRWMAIRVAGVGAAGKMGKTAVRCLSNDPRFEIVSLVGRTAGQSENGLPITADLADALEKTTPDVLVELTNQLSSEANILAALSRGIAVVVGSTGLKLDAIHRIHAAAAQTPCLFVPNFAVGAILMMKFAEMAAKWMPDVEIIELHHEKKIDAPSGTAMRTAELIAGARTSEGVPRPDSILKLEGARGAEIDGVHIHSVRLPGLLAHQEVIFGGVGEVLTIKHDSMDRSSFELGIRLSVERVRELQGVHVGLDQFLF